MAALGANDRDPGEAGGEGEGRDVGSSCEMSRAVWEGIWIMVDGPGRFGGNIFSGKN